MCKYTQFYRQAPSLSLFLFIFADTKPYGRLINIQINNINIYQIYKTIMYKRLFLLFLTCFSMPFIHAQSPEESLSEFDWLTGYIQRNYPGYHQKTKDKEQILQEKIRQSRSLISHQPDTLPCLMDEYLSLFNDGHLYFQITPEGRKVFHDIIKRESIRRNRDGQSGSINMYYTAKVMNDSTFFLRIPSFGNGTCNRLVEENWNDITSRPYLIVDLRCNGGGNDENFSRLMELVYSRPYWKHGVEMYATPDIAALYRKYAAEATDEESVEWLNTLADSVENNLGGYVLRPGMQRRFTVTRDTVYTYPRKIAILIHRRNASSAEQFILEAKESDKVVLFGNENTKGCIDLSNVFSIQSPKGWFSLNFPTTRSCRYPETVIDGIGISPQIPVPYKESLQEKDSIGEEIRYIEHVLREKSDSLQI